MSLRTDKVQLEIIIKGDKTRQELSNLEAQSKKLARELKRLPEGSDEFIKKSAELKGVQKKMDDLRRTIGLTGLTMRELRTRQRELNLALNNMDPRTAKYKELRAELALVNGRMNELRGTSTQAGFSIGKLANGFNKYFTLFAAFAASLTGVVLSMRKMVDEFANFEKAVSGLSALTGLEGEQLDWLADKAKEMSTSMVEGNIRITSSAEDIVNAYTKVGSKMPELLSDQEALNEVTTQALILAQAGNIDLDTAVNSLTNTMNQFRLPAADAAMVINEIAAGAKYGAADIDFIGTSIVKFGAAANAMGVDVTRSITLIEVMGKAGLDAERGGTALKTFLLRSAQQADEFNISVVGLDQALINLKNANLSAAEMTKMFGTEAYVAAQSLVTNLDVYQDLVGKLSDTEVAFEMAAENTDNHAAEMEQSRNKAKLLSIELGEKLAPVMMFSTNTARKFLITLMNLPKIISENKNLFILLGAALLILYQRQLMLIAVSLKSYAWGEKSIIQVYRNIKARVAETFALGGVTTATTLQQKAVILLNAAWKKFRLGMIIAGITAIYFAFKGLSSLINKQSAEQKLLNDINVRANEIMAEERTQLMMLAKELKNTNEGTEERKVVIDKINEAYGSYLPQLLTEKDSYDKLTKSLMLVNVELLKKAKIQAVSEKLVENEKALLEVQEKQKKLIAARNSATGIWNIQQRKDADLLIDAAQAEIDALNKQNKLLVEMQGNMGNIAVSVPSPKPVDEFSDSIEEMGDSFDKSSDKVEKWVNKTLDAEVELYLSYLRDVENHRHALNLKQMSQEEYYDTLKILNARYRKQMADAAESDSELVIPDITKPSGNMSQEEVMKAHDETLKLIEDEKNKRLEAINSILFAERRSRQEKLDALNLQYQNGFILEEEYQQALLDLKADYAQRAAQIAQKITQDIALETLSVIDTLQQTAHDKQITRINDTYNTEMAKIQELYDNRSISEEEFNARKKKADDQKAADETELKVKQTNREAVMRKAEIGVRTAQTLFEIQAAIAGFTATGNLPMAILAGVQIPLLLGASIAQIAAVEAAKNKSISEFATGNYPLVGESGKQWMVSWGGKAKTGMVNKPTHYIAGDGKPEMIIDYPTLRNIQLHQPEILNSIMQMRVNPGGAKEYADGNYPIAERSRSAVAERNPSADNLLLEMVIILRKIDNNLSNSYTFKDLYDKLQDIEKKYKKIKDDFSA